jgi:hypothetical protein
VVSAILVSLFLTGSVFSFLLFENNAHERSDKQGVFVGVAYCGDSVAGGKLLIDKVKQYTNLFILQSASLQRDFKSVNELGDYAVASGLYFLPYFGTYVEPTFSAWIKTASQKWGDHFIGVYYGDESGGKMLDGYVQFKDEETGYSIMKTTYGDIVLQMSNGIVIHYEINGGIVHLSEPTNDNNSTFYSTFYPNGTTTGQLSDASNFKTYDDLMRSKPFKNNDDAAQKFVDMHQNELVPIKNNEVKVFTSDYNLYWWDYLGGYDVILAQLGWNISVNQQIALVRGAANLQNRDWGIVVTWKYNQPPYLDTGKEIFAQMSDAYDSGAKYFVLFDYYEDNGNNPYGTLQDEHFQSLENFWKTVVNNPKIIYGSTKADSVLVLPKNYGWGMRWQEDKIWGIFNPDDQTKQIWTLMQTALANHGIRVDIIYEDTNFPIKGQYQNIYTWNQK